MPPTYGVGEVPPMLGGGEEAAWAEVVAAALDSTRGVGSPALALSGDEVAPPTPAAGPTQEAEGPDLDHLADSVYEIIRRRLRDESERTWT